MRKYIRSEGVCLFNILEVYSYMWRSMFVQYLKKTVFLRIAFIFQVHLYIRTALPYKQYSRGS